MDRLGFGASVPPLLAHVEVYFVQAGRSVLEARDFFEYYQTLGWRNKKGHLIKDWKAHAWRWIWYGTI